MIGHVEHRFGFVPARKLFLRARAGRVGNAAMLHRVQREALLGLDGAGLDGGTLGGVECSFQMERARISLL